MKCKAIRVFLLVGVLLLVASCSPRISGTVQLVDINMQPVVNESPEGTIVNMINTTTTLEKASHSIVADKEGKFESEEDAIVPGTYKVEVKRIGYVTETKTVEIGKYTREELDIKLKKIHEGKRKSIRGAETDEDKIINPGEVNIQPPMM